MRSRYFGALWNSWHANPATFSGNTRVDPLHNSGPSRGKFAPTPRRRSSATLPSPIQHSFLSILCLQCYPTAAQNLLQDGPKYERSACLLGCWERKKIMAQEISKMFEIARRTYKAREALIRWRVQHQKTISPLSLQKSNTLNLPYLFKFDKEKSNLPSGSA